MWSESTALNESWPSPTCSPVNPVDHFRWKELFTRFTLVDSTVLINQGDPCKCALTKCSSLCLDKLTVVQHLTEFQAFYATRNFVNLSQDPHRRTLCQGSQIQSTTLRPLSLKSTFISCFIIRPLPFGYIPTIYLFTLTCLRLVSYGQCKP